MRKALVASLAVALALAGALLTLVMPRRCPVNRAAAERIEEGMTQAEVHAVLGGPPENYRTRPSAGWGDPDEEEVLVGQRKACDMIEAWEGDEAYVRVCYGAPAPG